MTTSEVVDAAGRRRSPANMPGFHCGRPPRNKGRRYPADSPTIEEIVPVMRCTGDRTAGRRTRALVVLLCRAGLRISEALALAESDLNPERGSILVRRGKGGRRREVGMDARAWGHVNRWNQVRLELPVGAHLCVIDGPTAGRPGRRQPLGRRSATSRWRPRFAGALLLISYATLTKSRWHGKV